MHPGNYARFGRFALLSLFQVKKPYILQGMDQANKILGLLVFFGAAMVTAMILAFFAHDGLGVRLYVIRDDALVSALLCSGMLVIALVSKWSDKRK